MDVADQMEQLSLVSPKQSADAEEAKKKNLRRRSPLLRRIFVVVAFVSGGSSRSDGAARKCSKHVEMIRRRRIPG